MQRQKVVRKGQSILAKPIVLVMIIALLSFLIFFMLQQGGGLEKRSSRLDLLSTTSDTLSLLVHSPQCLAYQPEEGGAYGSTISAGKLEEFETNYSNREPLCARNFLYGWQAQVKDLSTDRTWQFGAQEFSKQGALKNSETRQMSVSLRYSPNRVNPGRVRLKMVNGELERIGEKLNYLCASGAAQGKVSFYNSYPLEVKTDRVCMKFTSNQSCRPLLCQVGMPEVESQGEHLMRVTIEGRTQGANGGPSGISKTEKTAEEIILRKSDLPSGSTVSSEGSAPSVNIDYEDVSLQLKNFKSSYMRSFKGNTFDNLTSGVFVFSNYRNREIINDLVSDVGSGVVAPRIGYNSIVIKEGEGYLLVFAKKNVLAGLWVDRANSKQQVLDWARIMANRI